MRKVSIKAVKEGMVLAEPLKNAHGGILLEKGVALTEVLAARLSRLGVSRVCIEGDPESGEGNVSIAQSSQIQKIPLEKLFDGKIVNSSMQKIYDALMRCKEHDDG